MALQVHDKSEEVQEMAIHWNVISDLLGGTDALRSKPIHMPQQPAESDEDYAYRLQTATVFPAFARTAGVLAGKPFSQEIILNDDVPAQIKALAQDIDGEGRSLHAFASQAFAVAAIQKGFGGILVDYTKIGGEAKSLHDERKMGARPYWVFIHPEQVLGWKVGGFGGQKYLTQLRLQENIKRDDGGFGEAIVERIRVLEPGKWFIYEKLASGWAIVDKGVTSLQRIPFVPIYGEREGFMKGKPPLLELAYQNIKHWQQQSDQDASTRFNSKRLLVFTGLNDGDKIVLSSSSGVTLPQGADAKIVQGSAEAVTVGRSELEALEDQMIQTGAELLVQKTGQRTATESTNDAEANKSALQRNTENFEDSIDQAMQFTAQWLNLPEGGHCSLFKDFSAATLSDATAQVILGMYQAGIVGKKTVIQEQKRRGVLSPDVDPETEIAEVEAEGPSLGVMNDNSQRAIAE